MDLSTGLPLPELPTDRELFESSVVGISLTRADGSYVAVNPAYATLFGYDSPAQLLA